MQIIRQALFEKVSSRILHYAITRNKITCVTDNQLIVLSIDSLQNKRSSIPFNGSTVRSISTSKDHVCILDRNGLLTVRRLSQIKEVVYSCPTVKVVDSYYPRIKWWEDELHLIYESYYQEINIYLKSKGKREPPFEVRKGDRLRDLEFCDLFVGIKNVMYQLEHSVHLCLNGVCLGSLHFERPLNRVVRMCHPLQDEEFNKQYLVVLEGDRWLKVFNIVTMKLIFRKELSCQPGQCLSIETDDLNEYLALKTYKKGTRAIEGLQLLKVNKDYYYSADGDHESAAQSFFLFDIEVGIVHDMQLFPSHSEMIGNKLCNSIDACFCEDTQINILSVVVRDSYRDQIYQKHKNKALKTPNNKVAVWREIVWAKMHPNELLNRILKKFKPNEIRKGEIKGSGVDICLEQQYIIQNILNNLKSCQEFSVHFNENTYHTLKEILYIEYFPMLADVMSGKKEEHRTLREIIEKNSQDSSNTMSGSSTPAQSSPRSTHTQKSVQETPQIQSRTALEDIDSQVQLDSVQKQDLQLTEQQGDIQREFSPLSCCYRGCDCQETADVLGLGQIEKKFETFFSPIDSKLQQIDHSLHRLQTLGKYKADGARYRVKRQAKQQKSVTSTVNKQMSSALSGLQQNISHRLSTISWKFREKPHQQTVFLRQVKHISGELDYNVQACQEVFQAHKEDSDELLDKLYHLEFADQSQQQEQGQALSLNLIKRLGKFEDQNSQSFKRFQQFEALTHRLGGE